MRLDRALLLLLSLVACRPEVVADGGSIPPAEPREVTPTRGEGQREDQGNDSTTPATVAACPPIDYAALEPRDPPPDPRVIALSQVFRRDEPREPTTSPAPRFDLGLVRFQRRGPGPGSGQVFGMGWTGLEASWVDGTLRPEIEPPFREWLAVRERLGDHQRASYLLDTRVRYAKSVEPPVEWGGLRCLERAAAAVEQREQAAEREVEQARAKLQDALESLSSRSSGETLLLAHLLADARHLPPESRALDRASKLLRTVADDTSLDRELRARAHEQLALHASGHDASFRTALEQVVALTRDPELLLETKIKLADSGTDRRATEALRMEVVEQLTVHDPGSWRVAATLAALAESRLEREAYELARDAAIRCAQLVTADLPRQPDPWGCAPVLAEALAELGEAPAKAEVPLTFLGPLAVASMQAALFHHDRDQAEHVGRLLLRELPLAAEAPEVARMLADLAITADARAQWQQRLARDYGPGSEWMDVQRERLAWEQEPNVVEQRLRAASSPSFVIPAAPRTEAEREQDLRERAKLVAERCELAGRDRGGIEVRVDTVASRPAVSVSGASRSLKRCLRRATGAYFRSVGPAKVRFRLVYE